MDRLVLSLLVENNPGVLNRVAGLFSRRGYNIESISVGQTNIKGMSRMTVVSTGDEQILTQIEKQIRETCKKSLKLKNLNKMIQFIENLS